MHTAECTNKYSLILTTINGRPVCQAVKSYNLPLTLTSYMADLSGNMRKSTRAAQCMIAVQPDAAEITSDNFRTSPETFFTVAASKQPAKVVIKQWIVRTSLDMRLI